MLSSGVQGIARLSEELHHFHGESCVLCRHLVETEIEVFGVFLMVLIETCVMHLRSETSRKVKYYLFQKLLKRLDSICTDVL